MFMSRHHYPFKKVHSLEFVLEFGSLQRVGHNVRGRDTRKRSYTQIHSGYEVEGQRDALAAEL